MPSSTIGNYRPEAVLRLQALFPTEKRSATPVKAMEHLYQLIVSAFAKFRAADLSTNQARFGLYGRWVVGGGDQPVPESELQL